MSDARSTRQAAQHLGITIWQLRYLMEMGRLIPPDRTPAGDYLWLPEDLDRARQAIITHRRPPEVANVQ